MTAESFENARARQPSDNERSIAFLAERFHAPAGDVAMLYEDALARLTIGARVTTFIHILALREVQDALRKGSSVGT